MIASRTVFINTIFPGRLEELCSYETLEEFVKATYDDWMKLFNDMSKRNPILLRDSFNAMLQGQLLPINTKKQPNVNWQFNSKWKLPQQLRAMINALINEALAAQALYTATTRSQLFTMMIQRLDLTKKFNHNMIKGVLQLSESNVFDWEPKLIIID